MINIPRTVQRLQVFSATKKFMVEQRRCPTPVELTENLDLDREVIRDHMLALRKASGLPVKIPTPLVLERMEYELIHRERLQKYGISEDAVYC
jgi:hypothetical protein